MMKNKDKPPHVQDPRYKKRMQRKGLTDKPQDTDYPRDPYKDDRYPERECDYCHHSYKGPAVYCSLRCALVDA